MLFLLLIALASLQSEPADAWGTCLAESVDRHATGSATADAVADLAMRDCQSHAADVRRSIEAEAGGATTEVAQEVEAMTRQIRQEMRTLAAQTLSQRGTARARSTTEQIRETIRRQSQQAQRAQAYAGSRVAFCPAKLGAAPSLVCQCSAQAATVGTVWGSDFYTDDSNICRAAVHAGMIGAGGGTINVRAGPGQTAYASVNRNGVRSSSWPRWGRSISFQRTGTVARSQPSTAVVRTQSARAPCPANARAINGSMACTCSAESVTSSGAVWGSGPYTADSRICRAARHAGAVGPNGGNVTVRIVAGLRSYSGSNRNGVAANGWGPYGTAFIFER